MKPAKFWVYPCRGVLHTPRNALRRRFRSKIGRVFGVFGWGNMKLGRFWVYPYWENMKPAKFFTYPCRAQKHTPRKNPRQRFGCKTGRGLRYVVCGNMKPVKFCMYPCRGVLHTPRKTPRRRFRPKTERVLGVSLLGWVKSGAFLTYSGAEIWNRAGFARTRVGAQKHTPRNVLRRRFAPKIGWVLGVSV